MKIGLVYAMTGEIESLLTQENAQHLQTVAGVPFYQIRPDVIACVRDICEYIYGTHGRFPAHCDAIHVPGIWLQVHHPEIEYYDRFFRTGLTEAHRLHAERWHDEPAPHAGACRRVGQRGHIRAILR